MARAIGLFVFWIIVVLTAGFEGHWYYAAQIRPIGELRKHLGEVPDGARVVAFRDYMSFRGGRYIWNIRISPAAAIKLRERCRSPANLSDVNVGAIVEGESSRPATASSPTPRGCLLSAETLADRFETSITLQGDLLQIEQFI
jgi:hypothetical protein